MLTNERIERINSTALNKMEDSKNICSTAIKAKAIEFKSVNDINVQIIGSETF